MEVCALRHLHGIRQTQLAGATAVVPSVVEAWERGEIDSDTYASVVASLSTPFVTRASGPSTRCVYCSHGLDGSQEHVLLSALGGRLTSTAISCRECNNYLGSGAHRSLYSQLHPLLLMAGARDGRGRVHGPVSIGLDSRGAPIEMHSGGEIRLKGPRVDRRPGADGLEEITVYANTPDEAKQIAEGIARKKGKPCQIEEAMHIVDAPPKWNTKVSLGGGDHFQALASMVVALLAFRVGTDAVVADEGIQAICRYLRHDDLRCVWWALGVDLSLPPWALPTDDAGLRNVIAVSGDPVSGLAIGRVVLLGHLAFEVMLSNTWKGDRLAVAYAVDPLTGAEFGPHDFDAPWTARASEPQDVDVDRLRRALGEINWKVSKQHAGHVSASHAERATAQAVAEVFGGFKDGDPIEPHHIQDLAATAAELFMSLGRKTPLVRRKPVERIVRGLEARDRLAPPKGRRVPKV